MRLRHVLSRRLQERRLRRAGVDAGPGARVARSQLTRGTVIGHDTAINGRAVLSGPGSVRIGAWCAIGADLRVIGGGHSTAHPNVVAGLHWRHGFTDIVTQGDVTIGNGCWIGDRVTILPGATVGDGAVLAAGAVVRGTVEPYTIVGGVPAKLLRRRCSPEVADALVASAWWDWDDRRMAQSRCFFELDIATATAGEVRAAVLDGARG